MVVDSSLYMVEAPSWGKVEKVGPVVGKRSIQGVADLLYEERVWQSKTGLWFSPGGDWIAFATFHGVDDEPGQCCVQDYAQCGQIPRVR